MSRFSAIRQEIKKIEKRKEALFDFDKVVGVELRKYRKKRGLTLEQFASAMGFKVKSAVVMLETGKRKLSFRTFAKAVKAFETQSQEEVAADFVRSVFLKI